MAQIIAAYIALQQMANVVGRYQLAWGCVALALALMVQRRLGPVWRLVQNGETGNFTDAIFGMIISLLMLLGIFGLRRLFVDLKALALTDPLTGLANRRNSLQQMQREIERAQRTRRPAAFLMFDIDHFKQVNDVHGHPAGDLVLRDIAEIASREFRRIDAVGRIGGEEFLVVLPESDHEHATAAAERLRKSVAAHEFQHNGEQIAVTISIGVTVPEVTAGSVTVEEVLKTVDNALYLAKNGGRNRVIVANWTDRPLEQSKKPGQRTGLSA